MANVVVADRPENAIGRAWQAWCRFWFSPADPTPLCFMRIVAGLLTLYVHLAYSFDLAAFFGPNAWYDAELANETRREFPVARPEMKWETQRPERLTRAELAKRFQFPEDLSERRTVRVFIENVCRDATTRKSVIDFLERLRPSPEYRFDALNYIRQLPTDPTDRAAALQRYVDDELAAIDRDNLPAVFKFQTPESRPALRAEVVRYESALPRDRQMMSLLVNQLEHLPNADWETLMAFLMELPAGEAERTEILEFLEKWRIQKTYAFALGWHVYSPWFHVTDERVLGAIHTVHLVVIGLFTLGLFTRVTSVLTWLAALSYVNRSQPVLFGQDTMMNLALFYLMLSPCGATYSLDRLIARYRAARKSLRFGIRPEMPPGTAPLVSAGFIIRMMQVHYCFMYMSAGLSKLKGISWWSGQAPHGTLANPEFTPMHIGLYRDALQFLCEHRPLWEIYMSAAVLFTLFVEIGFPFLVWTRMRPVMVAASLLLHTGIALFMGLSVFSLFMFALVLCWIPPELIRRMFGRRPDALAALQLNFDPKEKHQTRVAARVYAADVWDQVTFSPGPHSESPRLVTPDGEASAGFTLAQRLTKHLGLLRPVAWLLRLPGVSHIGRLLWPEDGRHGDANQPHEKNLVASS